MRYSLPRSKVYRDRADECRALAELGHGLREQYLRLAATYDLIAVQTESLEAIVARLSRGDEAA